MNKLILSLVGAFLVGGTVVYVVKDNSPKKEESELLAYIKQKDAEAKDLRVLKGKENQANAIRAAEARDQLRKNDPNRDPNRFD